MARASWVQTKESYQGEPESFRKLQSFLKDVSLREAVFCLNTFFSEGRGKILSRCLQYVINCRMCAMYTKYKTILANYRLSENYNYSVRSINYMNSINHRTILVGKDP